MKGIHKITVKNNHVQYTLELERNVTVLSGDSGTGKTTLISLLSDYENLGKKSGVTVSCDKPCRVLSGIDWELRLGQMRDSIVFVDEGNEFLSSADFARTIKNSDNYYVLITRESLYQLPYSVDAVLELKKTKSKSKRTYNRAYPYYKNIPKFAGSLNRFDTILTEDSNSGFQMFAEIASRYSAVAVSAGGKSNIYSYLQNNKEKQVMLVADGAAFGSEMKNVYNFVSLYPNRVILYLPESFEWLILKSGVVHDAEISSILKNPSAFIESERYFSWEQFFTALLIRKTEADTYRKYSKNKLTEFYLQEKNVNAVISAIENDDVK